MIRRLPGSVLLALAVVALAAPARAQTPAEILEKMDACNNDYDDVTMNTTMTIVDIDGSKKSYDFVVKQNRAQKMLLRFVTGEVKGMATLIEDRNHMYVYLPGMKKTRRVAAHAMNQSFAGSDFSNDDMASQALAKIYEATLQGEDATHWLLKLTPKAGEKVDYGYGVAKVKKGTFQEDGLQWFDPDGKPMKTFVNGSSRDFTGKDGRVVPRNTKVSLTDERTKHRTELDIHDFKFNQGMPESTFTQRELEWGSN